MLPGHTTMVGSPAVDSSLECWLSSRFKSCRYCVRAYGFESHRKPSLSRRVIRLSHASMSQMNRSTSQACFYPGTVGMSPLWKQPSKTNAASPVQLRIGTGPWVSLCISRLRAPRYIFLYRCCRLLWLGILQG